MRLALRIDRLERQAPRGRPCGVCGASPGDPDALRCPGPRVIGEPAPPAGADRCPGCGRALVLRCPPPRALGPSA